MINICDALFLFFVRTKVVGESISKEGGDD